MLATEIWDEKGNKNITYNSFLVQTELNIIRIDRSLRQFDLCYTQFDNIFEDFQFSLNEISFFLEN